MNTLDRYQAKQQLFPSQSATNTEMVNVILSNEY